ncbi:MAG TPA: hypothetical protein VGH33_04520 [Isosphaeraceae bacterium]
MPSRWACVGLLLLWAVATVGLISRDVLPDLLIGPPPDLRSVAAADQSGNPTKWAILVADDPAYQSLRSVGQAVTESVHEPDGRLRLESKVTIDAGGLLKGTPFASREDVRFDVENWCLIDASGNLVSFRAVVRTGGIDEPLLSLDGVYKDHAIEMKARGPIPLLNFTRLFAYEPKTLIQNALGPIDRMPGLAIGQRWEERVVSPLTGKIDVVKAEVVRRSEIYWDKSMAAAYEVVHKIPPAITARTWVRKSDGLVLRQEVPFPVVKLMIERMPDSR